jgi:hypothetical protein
VGEPIAPKEGVGVGMAVLPNKEDDVVAGVEGVIEKVVDGVLGVAAGVPNKEELGVDVGATLPNAGVAAVPNDGVGVAGVVIVGENKDAPLGVEAVLPNMEVLAVGVAVAPNKVLVVGVDAVVVGVDHVIAGMDAVVLGVAGVLGAWEDNGLMKGLYGRVSILSRNGLLVSPNIRL